MIRRAKEWFLRLRRIPYVYDHLDTLFNHVMLLDRRVEFIQEALGRIESRQLMGSNDGELAPQEFRAFSQWGEDGIIQFLIRHVDIDRKVFVEFGADDYDFESNTRFLLTNNNWTGLVIDAGPATIRKIKSTRAYWLHNLKAIQAFITRENINDILKEQGVTGEIGLLSIDIDGNDYWVWQAIDVINPAIVIVEYNHRFGKDRAVTIPYDENFDRVKAHPSRLYFGSSLKALCILGEQKGYAFVGCNSNGVNAFFVRKDKKPASLKTRTAEEGYVPGAFGEMFETDGQLIKRSPAEESELLMELHLPLIEIENTGLVYDEPIGGKK